TGRGGERGRLLVADADGLIVNPDLPRRPDQDVSWRPVPSLLPAIRALASAVPHVVVRVDHTGADIEVNGGISGPEEELEVQGDHDVLHKFKGGGWSQRRFEERVQDSWEHNAATVARRLDRIVRRYRPEVVVVMGDERAMAFLEQHASEELTSVLVRSDVGGRAEGTDEEKERQAVESVLAATRAQAEADLVARFEEQTGRAEAATEGLAPVVEVLQRAQAEELILVEGRQHDDRLWVGEGRLQLGLSREDAEMTGSEQPVQVPADTALVWAAVCSRAAVTLVDRAQLNPADGVGAVLRWSDESTPRARVPSMPGHGGT
ncbi:MAG TPA: Vms1/Ankzf1 family peptidyl-tRNA hydrolase, partial [Terrabacter sp.]|nr:Vms1/Ankzf1 family peptidyl-tRNA hydrolase [Terrabacter sp.]